MNGIAAGVNGSSSHPPPAQSAARDNNGDVEMADADAGASASGNASGDAPTGAVRISGVSGPGAGDFLAGGA